MPGQCSTVLQDLTGQREILAGLGVPGDRIYLDKGLTGSSRRPGRPRPGTHRAAWRRPAAGHRGRALIRLRAGYLPGDRDPC